MAIDPISAGMAGAGLLSGFFGGGNESELPPEVARILRLLMKSFREVRQYGRGIPGSDPQEQAALASMKGLAGEDIGNSRERLLAGLGTNAPSAGDALSRFDSSASSTFAGMDMSALLDSLGRRQQARFGTAPGILAQAGGLASSGRISSGQDLSGLLAGAARTYGMSQYKTPQFSINYGAGGSVPGGYGPQGGYRGYPGQADQGEWSD